jgi:hypothetical protein
MSPIRAPQPIRFFGLGAILAFALSAAPGWGATLAGYWNLNEGTGTTAADSSGSGNTGTLINSPSWTTGELGSALNFASGGKGYVSASGAGSLANLYTHGMSVSTWIKPRSAGGSGGGRIIDKDNNNGGWFLAMNGSSEVRFAVDAFPTAGNTLRPRGMVPLAERAYTSISTANLPMARRSMARERPSPTQTHHSLLEIEAWISHAVLMVRSTRYASIAAF